METTKNNIPLSFEDAEGEIDYTMTNDYMFRAILQSNEKVLRGLIGSLLHLKQEEIATVKIENPIELGKAIGQTVLFPTSAAASTTYTKEKNTKLHALPFT